MVDPMADAELAGHFRNNAITSMPRAPLYAALSEIVAADAQLYRLLTHAPLTQRLPVLFLAATHAVLLEHVDDELARWYPNVTDDPLPPTDARLADVFTRFVDEHRAQIVELISTRSTQTNEVGRSALLLVAFGILARERGALGHVDVGASGGLNLLLDRFEHRYTPQHRSDGAASGSATRTIGGPSTVVLEVSTRGRVPVPASLPSIAARYGIDREPIDVSDDAEARWLEACVWPDQRDRFRRLQAAIDIARARPPELIVGDAISSLPTVIEQVAVAGHPVVTNSWMLSYLTADEQADYVAALDRVGRDGDLSWVFLESPHHTSGLPWPDDASLDPTTTVLALGRWRDGERSVERLAVCHPHGYWMHWIAG